MALSMSIALITQQAVYGAIAAAGFAVLFNISAGALPWCAASGALALAVRSCCQGLGWSLEGASFAAALGVGAAVQLLRSRIDMSETALDVVGSIPMVPGSFAAKAIVGLFATATSSVISDSQTLITAVQYTLRVMFIIGAIGTGLAIPSLLGRVRNSRAARLEV